MAKRKANGEGTIFKRKDGRWAAQAHITQADGTKKRLCFTGKNRESIKDKLRAALEENERLPFSAKEWSVSDYLDYWIHDIQPKRIRETTLIVYKRTIRIHLKPTVGHYKLRELSVHDVRLAMDTLENQGCRGAARQKCLLVLSSCLSNAMREELIYRNVAQLVERPQHTPKETLIWSAEQAAQFLQSSKEHPQHIAFLLLLTYGMRRGEVLGTRWCDIDFANNLIHVRQQIDRVNGEIKARDLKTKNSRRTLPLLPSVRDVLLRLAEKRNITIPPFNPKLEMSIEGTIVLSRNGKPLEPINLNRCFHILTEKMGLPRIKIHAARHTAATILKDLNVPIKDVQLILGHATIATTLSIYQHGTAEAQRSAMSALEKCLQMSKTSNFDSNNDSNRFKNCRKNISAN